MTRQVRPAARGQVHVPSHHYKTAARYRNAERLSERAEMFEILFAVAAFWAIAFTVEVIAHALGF